MCVERRRHWGDTGELTCQEKAQRGRRINAESWRVAEATCEEKFAKQSLTSIRLWLRLLGGENQ